MLGGSGKLVKGGTNELMLDYLPVQALRSPPMSPRASLPSHGSAGLALAVRCSALWRRTPGAI